jgi:hypothetical protein
MSGNSLGDTGIGDRSGRGASFATPPFYYESVSDKRYAPSSDTDRNALKMNIQHTHNYDHKHNITADGGTEARPDNYTIRVWKRTA